jgi:hypothetical protein
MWEGESNTCEADGLLLAMLLDAQPQAAGRWIFIQPSNIQYFLGEALSPWHGFDDDRRTAKMLSRGALFVVGGRS